MNVQVSVVLDVSPRLEALLAALLGKVTAVPTAPQHAKGAVVASQTNGAGPDLSPSISLGVESVYTEPATTVTEQSVDTPVVSLEVLRAMASDKGKSKVKPLLDECGFASISVIPEGERAAFKARLEAA